MGLLLRARRRCCVIPHLLDWIRTGDRRADLCRILAAHAGTLDHRVRGHTPWSWNSHERKGDASERSCAITILLGPDSRRSHLVIPLPCTSFLGIFGSVPFRTALEIH